jgi:hypothetical protein
LGAPVASVTALLALAGAIAMGGAFAVRKKRARR